MPWVKYEDATAGDVVVELTATTLSLYYWQFNEGVTLHLAMLTVEVEEPDRKGRRQVRVMARPGAVGAGFRLKVPEHEWRRVDALLELVGPAQRALEPPVA
ncbi:hypothetical protein [Nocardioides sp.]|uniref:hypothetical protein n=1 Tax=Nocardioides sp. TaxID=35761 RepID=UPI00271C51BE|nr:hypothetical protein [Nocardioides sp.]MDO9457217.1 hypothetical protein [Nocardioides sp.]